MRYVYYLKFRLSKCEWYVSVSDHMLQNKEWH